MISTIAAATTAAIMVFGQISVTESKSVATSTATAMPCSTKACLDYRAAAIRWREEARIKDVEIEELRLQAKDLDELALAEPESKSLSPVAFFCIAGGLAAVIVAVAYAVVSANAQADMHDAIDRLPRMR